MRVALGIEYDGSAYFGWQRQRDVPSVQEHLENALSRIASSPITVKCAGRTDAGVHATGQVVHFDCPAERAERAWTLGANTYLPKDIAVTWMRPVEEDFHARFSATSRRYRYIIYNNQLRSGILAGGMSHIYTELDHELMHEAAQCLIGKHDFSTFRASLCQAKSPVRTLTHIDVTRKGHYLMLEVQANAFLHHMVRNIAGSLMQIGGKVKPVQWMQHILESKDRTLAAATAKPNGLYLVKVDYPEAFNLPQRPLGPVFWD